MNPPTPRNPLLAALRAKNPRLTDYPKLALVASDNPPPVDIADPTLISAIELLNIINELRIGSRCAQAMMQLYQRPLKPTDLARATHVSAAAVTGLITRLRMLGMATSERVQSDSGDRREVCVTLTTAGRRVVSYIILMLDLHDTAQVIKTIQTQNA
jgi:DNA-binding MarR family transcriptional regulator